MDEVLCREAIICGDILKFKKFLSNRKINLEKKSYGKSIIELISQTLNFKFLQEFSKSISIDLNLNYFQLSQQNIDQFFQAI
mgnify:CR=1 FL=1